MNKCPGHNKDNTHKSDTPLWTEHFHKAKHQTREKQSNYSTHSVVRKWRRQASQPLSKMTPGFWWASQPAHFLKVTRKWAIRSVYKELPPKSIAGCHIVQKPKKKSKTSGVRIPKGATWFRRFQTQDQPLLDNYWVTNEKFIGFGTGARHPIDCRIVFRL